MSDEDKIKQFLLKIITQDNRSTAFPFFYVIRTQKYTLSDCGSPLAYWGDDGMFLTESDAETHLKEYHYRYSKDAHTYVKHSEGTELNEFFIALFDYFDMYKKKDGES